jgi:perosamine synthetase
MRPWLGTEESEAAAEAVRSGWVAQGPRVAEFEASFAEFLGADHAVAVSSCTAALHLSLALLNLAATDEVVVPSLSFIATANAVRYVGAQPVFADVDPYTANITAATIEAVATPRTRAVMIVHQAGIPADVEAIRSFCDSRGIAVIEDAACAIGSRVNDRLIGTGSDLVSFSFHPRKLLTTGEGGMIVCRRSEDASRARRLREHGMSSSAAERHSAGTSIIESYDETGFNYRMTDIQAAIGIVQLGRVPAIVERRRQLASRYAAELGDIPGIRLACDPPYGTSNFQSYWVVLPPEAPLSRNELLAKLMSDGISGRRGIMAAHLEPAYAEHKSDWLPVTELLTHNSLILPLYHELTEDDQSRVIASFRRHIGVAS